MEAVKRWLENLERLAQLMSQRNVVRLELSLDGLRVRMVRAAQEPPVSHEETMPRCLSLATANRRASRTRITPAAGNRPVQ
jgi:hypothetical protein